MFKKLKHLLTGKDDKEVQTYKDEVTMESVKTSKKLNKVFLNKDTVYYIGKAIGGLE